MKKIPNEGIEPKIDGYFSPLVSQPAPEAAKFNRGASGKSAEFGHGAKILPGVEEATAARREHSRQLTENPRFAADEMSRQRGIAQRARDERLKDA